MYFHKPVFNLYKLDTQKELKLENIYDQQGLAHTSFETIEREENHLRNNTCSDGTP